MSGSVVLLSGGLDSAAALIDTSDAELALTVHYGQTHAVETVAAMRIAQHLGVPHEIASLPMDVPSSLVTRRRAEGTKVVPVRNLMLITMAAVKAAERGLGRVVIGTNASDHNDFPDCRLGFLRDAARCLAAYGIDLDAPWKRSSKADVVRYLSDNEPYVIGMTWSCYDPQYAGARKPLPCGLCGACSSRAASFAEVGIDDPAR